ncbi:unnamed protein product [Cladocopium goreaui]|uniref:Nipped-B-like protein B n=1 Tax=Cladocopium goreaui TaxID=2562237 RepID=A0A9P1GGS9_9DINO|nr:unnamed protein product [Cladocopium goreaui]
MTVVELKLSWITLKCKEVSSFPELEEESTEPPFELFGNVWKYHSFPLENSSQHHSKILSPSHPHSCHHCPEIGPGYYDLPSLLDEHSVTITASERFQEQMPGETPGPGSYTQVRRVRCGSWRAGQKVEHNPHGN